MPHKLLLADDSVTIQRVIELTFADEDVHVIAVGDGKQAIDRIQKDRPDIVLADVGMPERDGYEVAAFVKGHPEFAHVPVLLLTGAFEPIDEGRARAAGCDGVLVKPFEPQMVINRVKDLLAGRRPAGLWAAAPSAQPSRAPVASDFDLRTVSTPPEAKGSGASLEEYFDRLDAAFAELDSTAPAAGTETRSPTPLPPQSIALPPPDPRASLGSGDALADWDPELSGDPSRPSSGVPIFKIETAKTAPPVPVYTAPVPTPEPQVQAPPVAVATPEPTPLPALPALPHGPSLAEAFAALLAAEQGQSIAPASVRPEDIPDDTIEAIVRRVIERMGTDAVRPTVLDVAERMVREEIARIKRGSS
jgi:CheY-like chemotaxis protein